jgi:type I restriction enzyme M protein
MRTNNHFSLKQNSLSIEHLRDFIKCYNSKNIHDRKETYSEENKD